MSRHAYKRPTLSFLWYWFRTTAIRVVSLAIFLVIAPTLAVTLAIVMVLVAITAQTIKGGVIKKDIY